MRQIWTLQYNGIAVMATTEFNQVMNIVQPNFGGKMAIDLFSVNGWLHEMFVCRNAGFVPSRAALLHEYRLHVVPTIFPSVPFSFLLNQSLIEDSSY